MYCYSIMVILLMILLTVSANAGAGGIIVDSNVIGEKQEPKPISLDPLSVCSLFLIQTKGNIALGQATGFVVHKDNKDYLITNWHVVTGRNPASNKVVDPSGIQPDTLIIAYHGKQLGTWVQGTEPLYDPQGKNRWREHKNGQKVDVVALPLESIPQNAKTYPLDLALTDVDMVPEVAMPVSIIGFPLGLTGAGIFPVWKTGHIASEPALDCGNEPLFLIDATTRGGMSGSPVVLRLWGGYKTKDGSTIMTSSGCKTLFLGIYSGRSHEDSEIGRVWRPRLITEILTQ